MEYIYAVILLHGAGKEITESSVINVFNAAGINPDGMRVKALIAALEGVDIEALKAPIYTAALAPAASPAEEKKAEKPEKEVKEEEEEDLQGLSILFGPPS